MLRAILALLFAILYLIIGIPVLFVEWIIGKFNRQAAEITEVISISSSLTHAVRV